MKSNKGNIVRWQDVALLSVAILLSISGFFKLIPGLDSVWSHRILGAVPIFAILFHIRCLLRNYYAGYSWYAIFIMIGILPGKVVRYEDIEINSGGWKIDMEDGDQLNIDFNEDKMEEKDISKSLVDN
ncbi:hypothetical protein [Mangrovibacterium diazotrophicum]|uniref:Uncharacterized protein n=1 Tax=Mangrovibacterium diazotrophicum TaxID=1261403 RepID=A0A419W9F9_9BACT|nr:hypothetical protein [Mangrovibacterium diazotrophicum]RKD92111.1 hypothetical protein BC643_2481 [Mangrovibacterium diazotrophicum]